MSTAVNTAKALGASSIVATGGWDSAFTTLPSNDSALAQPGITVFASLQEGATIGSAPAVLSDYPASSPNVISVGVTSLALPSALSTSLPSESASGWSLCHESAEAELAEGHRLRGPDGQRRRGHGRPRLDLQHLPGDGSADLNDSGWSVQGGPGSVSDYGTPVSNIVASSLVAAIFAQTGNGGAGPSYPYAHPSYFNDVTTGSDGSCAGYMCNAGVGTTPPRASARRTAWTWRS